MALWTLLRHRLQAAVRAPFVGRRALSLILGGFMALYLGGGLVLVGLVFDDLVRGSRRAPTRCSWRRRACSRSASATRRYGW